MCHKQIFMLKSLAILSKEINKMPFFGSIEFRGLNGKLTTRRWKLQTTGTDGTAFEAAVAALDAIKDEIDPITEASINDVTVSFVTEAYVVGAGDLTKNALLNVWAEDPANAIDVLAISQVYVPAPVIGIFQGTSGTAMDIVDVNDADLQAFVDALAANAYISDHEVIDTGTAVNGIENGRRVTRKA